MRVAWAWRGLRAERQIVMGFSQGACLSCEYIWRQRRRYRALIAFTGGRIGPADMQWAHPGANLAGMPVFLADHDNDPWVPASRMLETGAAFRAAAAHVIERIYPGSAHDICAEEIDLARSMPVGAMEPAW